MPASQIELGIQTDILQPLAPAPRTVIARRRETPNRIARREQTVQSAALIAAGIVIARTKNDGWGFDGGDELLGSAAVAAGGWLIGDRRRSAPRRRLIYSRWRRHDLCGYHRDRQVRQDHVSDVSPLAP